MNDTFHEGEIAVQEIVGVRNKAEMVGRMIADRVPAGARGFVENQRYCILGRASTEGEIWATFLAGPQGFISSNEDGSALRLRLPDTDGTLFETPAMSGLSRDDQLGVLLIELGSRRRLRVNGRVKTLSGDVLHLQVAESFPNCPKYIQRRDLSELPAPHREIEIKEGQSLNDELVAWVTEADTFFVASAYRGGPVDASHRGGKPGFVKVENGVFRIPDYPGNSLYGTLGNFAVNPHAGLVFIDFENNRQLQLSGDVHLDLDGGEAQGETGGTGRWWEFTPRRWVISPLSGSFEWRTLDASPFNP